MTRAVQSELTLVHKAPKKVVPLDIVSSHPDMLSAIRLCTQLSGLDPKKLYPALGFNDQGHYSCCLSGEKNLDPNKLNLLMDVCGNEAPLIWLANSRGYGLVVLKSEAEKRADDLQKKLDEAELENRVLMKALGARK